MEKFFQTIGGIGEEEIILCISQLGFDFANVIPIGSLCRSIFKMLELKKEQEIKMQWSMMLPFMSLGMLKYMSFEDYKNKCTGGNIDTRPSQEILADVAKIREEFERKEK